LIVKNTRNALCGSRFGAAHFNQLCVWNSSLDVLARTGHCDFDAFSLTQKLQRKITVTSNAYQCIGAPGRAEALNQLIMIGIILRQSVSKGKSKFHGNSYVIGLAEQ
jgi:hypothetical protein